MGLYGRWSSEACDRECRRAAFDEHVRSGLERDARAVHGARAAESPAAVRTETGGEATAVVEAGVATAGFGSRALRAITGVFRRVDNGSER